MLPRITSMNFKVSPTHVVTTLILSLSLFSAQADVKEYVRDYDYQAAEYDTRYSSRISAIDELKLSLQHELGTYISSVLEISQDESGIKDVTHDTVQITAGILSLKLLEERWNDISYYVKGLMKADKDEILAHIKAIRNDYEMAQLLRSSMEELEELRAQVAALKQSLKDNQSGDKSAVAAEYQSAMQDIDVETIFQQAMSARIEGDFGRSFELLKGLAEKGDSKAQVRLGRLYTKGVGVDQDYKLAMDWLKKAQAQGDANALVHIGHMHEKGLGVAVDELFALSLYKQAIDSGSKVAGVRLGNLYIWGKVVPQDYAKAIEYIKPAAEKGNSAGLNAMGFLYEKGWGVDKDLKKTVDYYEKAIGKGNAHAMGRLGRFYFKGTYVDRDLRKAFALLTASAERGDGFGQAMLGRMYEKGKGVDKDENRAFELFKKSADSGNLMGTFMMGHAYDLGIGVKSDRSMAKEWFMKAAAGGHPKAKKRLKKL